MPTQYKLPLSSNPEAIPFPAPGTIGTDEELALHFPGDCAYVKRRIEEGMYRDYCASLAQASLIHEEQPTATHRDFSEIRVK